MDLALHLSRFDIDGGPAAVPAMLGDLGRTCDDGGITTLSVMDHYLQMEWFRGGATDPMLEAYTTLGYLAARTRTVRLQTLVTGVTYRSPGLLAKIVATLDVLSEGRAGLGIGAAWYEREHHAYGVPYASAGERLARLEETLQVVRQVWSDDDGPYEGQHYRLAETICAPRPIGTIPVMVGGGGEKVTLRLVARYADACNLFAGPDSGADVVAHKLEALREHCDRVGRSYDAIRRTILWNGPVALDGSFVEAMRPFADLGVEQVFVMPLEGDPVAFAQGVADGVVPALTRL
ncbi:F420-dependent oxidoreductase-like protein [Mumia flava]|uniref:F420-dependent oxidoreductase-like protein n=1 Tax=Mumia flava TaxID=1348852 RepID=A0A0B2B2X9_9ACTN|nr:LLM class F420-dependent oxidoreductase [Mumia flava]PJJ54139.1 F420-dependent oxidoreductase-like protein [Mumia flava]